MKQKLTAERLRAILSYDPATGVFTRLVDSGGCGKPLKAGTPAGWLDSDSGYVRIGIDGVSHWAHRLAWLHVHGFWPAQDIDHMNGQRADNRIANLRDVSRAHNLQNQTRPAAGNTSGIRGIRWDAGRKRWRVEISVGNRNRFVGRFKDIEAAKAARTDARLRFHPGAIL